MTKEALLHLKIEPLRQELLLQAKEKWDSIAKPLDGFGRFETMLARIGAIKGTVEFSIGKKAVIVMCADNGVVEEGISQTGQEITLLVTKHMGLGLTSVAKMAKFTGADLVTVDIGVNSTEEIFGVRSQKVAMGTKNFMNQPAMTEEELLQAISIGMELVWECKEKGYELLATGEMGIGNTTTAAAVTAALLGRDAVEMTGRGAGLDDTRFQKKQRVIQEALEKYALWGKDPFTILRTVGGLDIAGLTGVFLGGAVYHVPIVLDGVISAAAALAAERLCPGAKAYMIPSHMGKEGAMAHIFRELELEPVIYGELAVGEGSGAVLLFPLLDLMMDLYQKETTFQDFKMEPYQRNG